MARRVTADSWNFAHHIGDRVRYFPVKPGTRFRSTRIRSSAWMLPSGALVVLIDGVAGAVSVEHLRFVRVIHSRSERNDITRCGKPVAELLMDCEGSGWAEAVEPGEMVTCRACFDRFRGEQSCG